MPIVITKEKLKEWGVCSDAYRWAAPRLNGGATLDQAVLAMKREDWLLWLLWHYSAVTHPQLVKLACMCVRQTLHIYEKRYPDDMRPRRAIEAAEAWSDDPTKKNRVLATDAANAAYTAYIANATVCYAAYAADAAYAAYAAACAAAYTAYATVCYATYAAAYAVSCTADAAARKKLHTKMCAGIVEKLREWRIIK